MSQLVPPSSLNGLPFSSATHCFHKFCCFSSSQIKCDSSAARFTDLIESNNPTIYDKLHKKKRLRSITAGDGGCKSKKETGCDLRFLRGYGQNFVALICFSGV